MIEQLQLGTVGAVAFLSGAYPPVTIFDLPFVFSNNPAIVRKIPPRERERFGKATESMKNVYIKRIGEDGKNSLKCLKRTSLPIQSRHTPFLETLGCFCGHSVFTTPL